MLRIFTKTNHPTFTSGDFTIFTDWLNRRSNFHNNLFSKNYAALGHIIGAHFYGYSITR
jgi:hypothetical protein